jgi:hypothetical protein
MGSSMRPWATALVLSGAVAACYAVRVERDARGPIQLIGDEIAILENYDAGDPLYLDRAARCVYWRLRYRDTVLFERQYRVLGVPVAKARRSPGLARAVRSRVASVCADAAITPRAAPPDPPRR